MALYAVWARCGVSSIVLLKNRYLLKLLNYKSMGIGFSVILSGIFSGYILIFYAPVRMQSFGFPSVFLKNHLSVNLSASQSITTSVLGIMLSTLQIWGPYFLYMNLRRQVLAIAPILWVMTLMGFLCYVNLKMHKNRPDFELYVKQCTKL